MKIMRIYFNVKEEIGSLKVFKSLILLNKDYGRCFVYNFIHLKIVIICLSMFKAYEEQSSLYYKLPNMVESGVNLISWKFLSQSKIN